MKYSLLAGVSVFALTGLASANAAPFSYSGGLEMYTVPTTGIYEIIAEGAQGGGTTDRFKTASGGLGYEVMGSFTLTAGDILDVAVGGMGGDGYYGGGGGGGTFVVDTTTNTPLLVAGGGGGASYGTPGYAALGRSKGTSGGTASNYGYGGGGGGGFTGNGQNAPSGGGGGMMFAILTGGAGYFNGAGGFGGGGGGGTTGGGGGGGYSGGNGGYLYNGSIGGSGGSSNLAGTAEKTGNGYASVTPPAPITPVSEPASLGLVGVGLVGLATIRRRVRR